MRIKNLNLNLMTVQVWEKDKDFKMLLSKLSTRNNLKVLKMNQSKSKRTKSQKAKRTKIKDLIWNKTLRDLCSLKSKENSLNPEMMRWMM